MRQLATLRPLRLVVIVGLCLALWGCGIVNPRPPRAVIESAIAQKLAQTQAILYRQFNTSTAPENLSQVGRLRVTDHHWTTVAGQSVVEVEGTYHLKGGSLTGAQRRQNLNFDVYLQRGDVKDQWLLLEPAPTPSGEPLRWLSTPLLPPANDKLIEPEPA